MKDLDDYDKKTLVRLLSYGNRKENGCLIFTGTLDSNGYGQIYYIDKLVRVTRLIMHLKQEFDLNSKSYILHKNFICNSKACFEEEHLYIGDASCNGWDLSEIKTKITHCRTCKLPLVGSNLIKYGRSKWCRNCKRKAARKYSRKVQNFKSENSRIK